MGILDEILERVGVVGSRIQHHQLLIKRDRIFFDKYPEQKKRCVIIDREGKRIVFDVSREIDHQFPSTVTSFPIENLSKASDHIVNENPVFSVTGLFSDWRVTENDGDYTTQRDIYRHILRLRDRRELLTLITPLDTYTSLALRNVSSPISDGTGTAFRVNLEFEKLRVVSNELTTVFTRGGSTGEPTQNGDTAIENKTEQDGGVKPASSASGIVNRSTFDLTSSGGLTGRQL